LEATNAFTERNTIEAKKLREVREKRDWLRRIKNRKEYEDLSEEEFDSCKKVTIDQTSLALKTKEIADHASSRYS